MIFCSEWDKTCSLWFIFSLEALNIPEDCFLYFNKGSIFLIIIFQIRIMLKIRVKINKFNNSNY